MHLSLCEPLGEFISMHEACNTVLLPDGIAAHLKRKHKLPAAQVKQQLSVISKIDRTKGRVKYWRKYFDDPYPPKDEAALPQLPLLKIYDIIKCPFCQYYAGNLRSCKAHMSASHGKEPNEPSLRAGLSTDGFEKGQTLYSHVPKLQYFPVTHFPVNEKNQKPFLPSILGLCHLDDTEDLEKEKISRKDRTMNTAAAIMNISGFMEARKLTFATAYQMTTFQSSQIYSGVMRVLKAYVDFFCERRGDIQQHMIDMVRLKNIECESTFSLNIQSDSRQRYIQHMTRIVAAISNLSKWSRDIPHTAVHLQSAAENVLSCAKSTSSSVQHLSTIHELLRSLFLVEVESSKGDRVILEDVYKLVLSGFSSSKATGGTRVGYSDDASHLCAALQFMCQVVALGEFMVPPAGFGPTKIKGSNSEAERREGLQELLSTTAGTPASFIRITLKKTKRLSRGDGPRISFAPCYEHAYREKVDNVEVMMNSNERGSIGYAIRSIQDDARKLLEEKILRRYPIPSSTWAKTLSFADNISNKDPGYFFGSHRDSKPIMDEWAENFAFYLTKGGAPIIERSSNAGGGEWKHSKHSSSWLRSCDRFMQHLYVLIHLCGGGPPRVTEMICAKLRNTGNARRNIVLYKGYLAILVSYTKTQAQFEKPKPIARFLDPETTNLLLSFIIFVKPVQSFLLKKSVGRIGVTDEYLFTRHGEFVSENTIYSFFRSLMHSKGVPFTVLLYRHYRTGIVKTFLNTHTHLTGDNAAFRQSGHSEDTALNCYAGIDYDFSEFTTAVTEAFLAVSLKWHEMAGIGIKRNEGSAKKVVNEFNGNIELKTNSGDLVNGSMKRERQDMEIASSIFVAPPLPVNSKRRKSTVKVDAERALRMLIGTSSKK